MPNTVSGTAFIHCLIMEDELLPKRSSDKNQKACHYKRLFSVSETALINLSVFSRIFKLTFFPIVNFY